MCWPRQPRRWWATRTHHDSLSLESVQPELGGAAVAFEGFTGALAGGGRRDSLDAAFVEPLVGGDLDVCADPEPAGIGAGAHGGEERCQRRNPPNRVP